MLQRYQREPTFPLEHKSIHETLYKTPEVSRDTCPHLRGTLKFPPQVKRARFSLPQIEMRVDYTALPGKECRRPCRTLRGGWYLLATGGEPGELVTI